MLPGDEKTPHQNQRTFLYKKSLGIFETKSGALKKKLMKRLNGLRVRKIKPKKLNNKNMKTSNGTK